MNGRRLFGLVFLGLGIWALAVGTGKAIEGFRAYSWPVAKGRVIISRIKEFRTTHRIRVARLCLEMDYLYMVGDKILEGHRVSVGWDCFGSETRIKRVREKYAPGTAVQVRYDPTNPRRSLLEPGLDWTVFFLWGIGLITTSVTWPLLKRRR